MGNFERSTLYNTCLAITMPLITFDIFNILPRVKSIEQKYVFIWVCGNNFLAIIAKNSARDVNWGFSCLKTERGKMIFGWNAKILTGFKPYQMPWNKSLKRFGIFLREIPSIKKSYKLIATSCCHKMIENWIGMDTEKIFWFHVKLFILSINS